MSSRRQRSGRIIAFSGGLLLSLLLTGPAARALAAASDPFPEASAASRAEAAVLLSARTGFPVRCATPAVRFARATAERYSGDPTNLTLFGHSVGAMQAVVVALSGASPSEGALAGEG